MSLFAGFYIVLSILVGYLGRGTRLGGLRSFIFSLFVTPIVVMLYLLLLASLERDDMRKARRDAR
jgi:hypothetical protein